MIARMKDDWDALAEAVRNRRSQLRKTQAELQEDGGPSTAKIREVENRRTTALSTSKRRDLERALRWTIGSVDAVLGGGEPTPLPAELNHPEPQLGAPRPQAPRADWPAVGSLAELPGYPSSFDHLFIEWSRNRDNMIHAEMQYALMRGINPLAARGELEEAARAYDAFNTGDGWNPPWFAAPKKHDLIGAQPSEEQSTEGGQDGLESASQSDAPPEGSKDKKISEQLANDGEPDPLTGLDRWRGDAGEVEDGDDSADETG